VQSAGERRIRRAAEATRARLAKAHDRAGLSHRPAKDFAIQRTGRAVHRRIGTRTQGKPQDQLSTHGRMTDHRVPVALPCRRSLWLQSADD